MKRSRLLQVTGIIMIIYAAATLVADLIAIFGAGTVLGLEAGSAPLGVAVVFLVYAGSLLGAVLMLVAGVLGVVSWLRPGRTGGCIALGCIILLLNIVTVVMSVVSNGFTLSAAISIAGMILPLLYLIAAIRLGRAA